MTNIFLFNVYRNYLITIQTQENTENTVESYNHRDMFTAILNFTVTSCENDITPQSNNMYLVKQVSCVRVYSEPTFLRKVNQQRSN